MNHTNHPRCNRTIGANNIPNTEDLRAEVTFENSFSVITSFWVPTDEEWEQLLKSRVVTVSVMGYQQPPIRVGVADAK